MVFPSKLILGVLGNVTAMALFLSPMPMFHKICKKKSTEEFSWLPYACTIFNCCLWILYGMPFVKPRSTLILSINGFGAALETIYICIFLLYTSKNKRIRIARFMAIEAIAYTTIVAITIFGMHSSRLRQMVVGIICVFVTVSMYASPLSIMGMVIKQKSVEYMPFNLSLFTFINGVAWSTYALVTRDIYVAIPNGLGCLLGIVQLILYAIYNKNGTPDAKEGPRISLQNVVQDNNNNLDNVSNSTQTFLIAFDGKQALDNDTHRGI